MPASQEGDDCPPPGGGESGSEPEREGRLFALAVSSSRPCAHAHPLPYTAKAAVPSWKLAGWHPRAKVALSLSDVALLTLSQRSPARPR